MHRSTNTISSNSVLIFSGVRGDTRRYRTFHPYEQLRLFGFPSILSHITDPNLEGYARGSNIVMIHRTPIDRRVERVIRTVEDRGGLVLLDADDLTFWPEAFQWIDSPDFVDPIRADLYQDDLRRNQQTSALAQGITASTDYLANLARNMGKKAWVCRNAFSLEMLAQSEQAFEEYRRDKKRVVIGYASGTPTHNKDFGKVVGAIQTILKKYPECEFWSIGPLQLDHRLGEFGDRVRQLNWVPWQELPRLLVQFDINLAPLVSDNPFCQSKSEIKYVESALVRVPTIATPTDAFQYAIRDGVNGKLADNTEEWVDAMEGLVCEPNLREKIGEQAYQDASARYSPYVRGQELVEVLAQASEQLAGFRVDWPIRQQRAENIPGPTNPTWEKHPTLFEMGIYNLRQRGSAILIKQIWVFFRRLLAPIFPYRR